MARPPLWKQVIAEALLQVPSGPQQSALQLLSEGGEEVMLEMAADAQQSPARLLAKLLLHPGPALGPPQSEPQQPRPRPSTRA